MKKLKRFALNDARMLSREELAAIEGGLDLHAVDNCTSLTKGQPCVFYSSYGDDGHQTIVIGTCAIKYDQFGSTVIETPYCM
ncbi:hypothetical protein [Paraprevotella xylaniphila]|uniref:hypothetical protein n=1 Tax=Paraprevotella xylaniphila TaxID=454155 RepID=UPI003AB43583